MVVSTGSTSGLQRLLVSGGEHLHPEAETCTLAGAHLAHESFACTTTPTQAQTYTPCTYTNTTINLHA